MYVCRYLLARGNHIAPTSEGIPKITLHFYSERFDCKLCVTSSESSPLLTKVETPQFITYSIPYLHLCNARLSLCSVAIEFDCS